MTNVAENGVGFVTLWDQLSDESTDAGKEFMSSFNELNASLGGSLGRLKEQPQDIQGRDTEIELLHACLLYTSDAADE